MRTFGLIPAAGKSRRMGKSKLLLPVDGRTVLEHVLSALRAGGVTDVLVITNPDGEPIAEIAKAAGAHILRLPEDTPDMRATCQIGLAWMETHFQPQADDAWLLLPADHPTVQAEVIRALGAALAIHRDKSIFVPVHQGRRGHPTLLRWSHVAAIRALAPDQGLNTYVRAHGVETLEVDWPSEEILRDLDTPDDYVRLIQEKKP